MNETIGSTTQAPSSSSGGKAALRYLGKSNVYALLAHVDIFVLPLLRTDFHVIRDALNAYLGSFKPSIFPAENEENKPVRV